MVVKSILDGSAHKEDKSTNSSGVFERTMFCDGTSLSLINAKKANRDAFIQQTKMCQGGDNEKSEANYGSVEVFLLHIKKDTICRKNSKICCFS